MIELLPRIFPAAGPKRLERYGAALVAAMSASAIDTPLRIAHFCAQLGHESGDLRYAREIASGKAYEGRKDLGNTIAGDGARFRGRGLIQLTGRANYALYSKAVGVDFVAQPEQLEEAPHAVDVAAWFWTRKKLNAFADQDDLLQITRRINGGTNGLEDRGARLRIAKAALSI